MSDSETQRMQVKQRLALTNGLFRQTTDGFVCSVGATAPPCGRTRVVMVVYLHEALQHRLRRSYLTNLAESGASSRQIQAQARHSRTTTSLEIYAQRVEEGQRRAVHRMMSYVENSAGIRLTINATNTSQLNPSFVTCFRASTFGKLLQGWWS